MFKVCIYFTGETRIELMIDDNSVLKDFKHAATNNTYFIIEKKNINCANIAYYEIYEIPPQDIDTDDDEDDDVEEKSYWARR